ncbi:hypothetical protein [Actinoplanes sp. NPDC049265]|uniref:hypothetical protein n=1 Tax=Actinoplanes sp. NPDC049265 TaxID=3363902 RepID=UPI0037227FB7
MNGEAGVNGVPPFAPPPCGGKGALPLLPLWGGKGAPPLLPPCGVNGALPLLPPCGGKGALPLLPLWGGKGALPLLPLWGGKGALPLPPLWGGKGALPLPPPDGLSGALPLPPLGGENGTGGVPNAGRPGCGIGAGPPVVPFGIGAPPCRGTSPFCCARSASTGGNPPWLPFHCRPASNSPRREPSATICGSSCCAVAALPASWAAAAACVDPECDGIDPGGFSITVSSASSSSDNRCPGAADPCDPGQKRDRPRDWRLWSGLEVGSIGLRLPSTGSMHP